jgi:hypothetical protein
LRSTLTPRLLCLVALLVCSPARALTPTTAFDAPLALQAAGVDIDLGGGGTNLRAVPRIVSWNADAVADLLVFAGDGYVWLYIGSGPATSRSFQAGSKLQFTSGTDIRIGTGYTGGAFVDLTNDGKPDLVIAGADRRVRLLANSGAAGAPAFVSTTNVQGASGDFLLPSNCGSRIDVVDWNADGLLDLLAGNFDGSVIFFANTGTATAPRFAAVGVPLTLNGTSIAEPHNTHPRAFDLNQDGIADLAYGVNWHYFQLCRRDSATTNDLAVRLNATDTTGANINLRTTNGDDATPDFADLNGDGVIDLVDGGFQGKVVVLYGRPYTTLTARIEQIMAAHPADLGARMAADTALRDELFGLHWALRDFTAQLQPGLATRTAIRDWYVAQVAAYPQYLPWVQRNKDTQQYVPSLAGQCWVNLLECMPDSPAHRTLVADTIGFTGWHRSLLTDLATIFIENRTSSTAQQKALYDIQASMPPTYRIVERITIRDFLVPTGATGEPPIKAKTGVNIFGLNVGGAAEGFPSDVPQSLIDTYCVAVAHELNHNVEAPAGAIFPTWYYQRKSELLKQGSPAIYVWTANANGTWTWNESATQGAFQAGGFWDGNAATWDTARTAYWATGGPAASYDKRWLRDNLRFCIEAPQEAFATLSNQYFGDSKTMLQLALNRYGAGNRFPINQFLWFAETYALGTANTFFWRIDTAAHVTRTTIPVRRGAGGRVSGLTVNGKEYDFALAVNGDVLATIPRFAQSTIVKPSGIATRAYSASLGVADVFDPNPAATFTFSKVAGPAWLTVAANGALTGTPPNGSAGTQTFTVRVTNGEGQTGDTTLQIPVITPLAPVIVAAPASRVLTQGITTQLVVTASGTPEPSYQWLKDGVPIPGATSSTYEVRANGSASGGAYTVEVSNALGKVTSAAAAVRVIPTNRLANLSVRSALETGQTLIVGAVVAEGTKDLLLRAAGPALNQFGLNGLPNPGMELYTSGSRPLATNDDWNATLAPLFQSAGAFGFVVGSRDAALNPTLGGAFTVQVKGPGSGAVLIEAYDLGAETSPRLVNLSARHWVGTGSDILVAGFAVSGVGTKQVLIRAVGPALTGFGVPGALADPRLEVYDGSGRSLAANDNWGTPVGSATAATTATFAQVGAFPLAVGSRDAALLIILNAGASHTVQVAGVNNTTGEALIEVYEVF